ncbi:MAG: TonB-dependent receptor [Burkholderiaceae bacterium]
MPASLRLVRRLVLSSNLALWCAAGFAQDTAPPAPPAAASAPRSDAPATTLQRVEINAARASPTEERRQSTAAKIVIGREEIEQYGDATLGDVLRRLPGVTQGGRPGRGGELRMRGMGSGYTQLLIDGQRAPRGFSIDQLDPEIVERIELFRAPTAETGTRAIAGTINIVLREPLRTLSNDVRAGFGVERGLVSPGASWTRNGALSETATYNLSLGARQGRQRTDTRIDSVYTDPGNAIPALDHTATDSTLGERDGVSLSSQARWRLGAGEFFMLQPFWTHSEGRSTNTGTLAANGGSTPAPYASRSGSGSSINDAPRLTAQLNRRIAEGTRIELRGSAGMFRSTSGSRLQQFGGDGSTALTQDSDTALRDRSALLSGKLLHLLRDSHSLVGGWEVERVARVESATTLLNGAPQIGEFGDDIRASTQRHALYLQDEWEPAPDWSANAGLRAEQIRTLGERETAPVQNISRVISPIAHLVWRMNAPRRDQVRLSLTQSYRPPPLQSLIAVPRFSTLFPPPGANTASSPDVAGNPALRPERANGVDLAFERYLGGGGILSVNLFYRRIRDLIRNVRTLEDVSWASSPRWVSRPSNLGDATTQGLEFDARFKLTEWRADAPAVNVRANLSLYRSRVDAVPSPDNRIDQQPRLLANLGADHRFTGTAWTLGGSAALTPGYRTQLTELQSQEIGTKRVLDAFLLWQIDPTTRLRLSLSNMAPRDSVSSSTIVEGTQTQATSTTGRTDTSAALRLEMRL